jgi:hypothetical protein
MLKEVEVPSSIDGINTQLKPIVRNCILDIAGDAVAEVIFKVRQACEHNRDNGLDKEVKDKRKDRDEVCRRDSEDWLLLSSLMLPDKLFDICQLALLNRACAL